MKITFWGAARTVTGSCYLLEHNNLRFLVDCGMFQGGKTLKERNYGEFPFAANEIDFVLLTHAHIDHSGLLPKLVNHGFKGPIYATQGTIDLAAIMLPDSGHIQEMEIERKNRKLARAGETLLTPIYTSDDAYAMQHMFKAHDYGEAFNPGGDLKIVFQDAGHILGSAFVEIHYQENNQEQKLVMSGDFGRYDSAIIKDPAQIANADYLVVESTYGNRVHKGNMEENMPQFAELINRTLAMGGNVIIPAFAVDRTQDILMMIFLMQKEGKIGMNSVYVDSPLAVKATEIFAKHPQYFDEMTTACHQSSGRIPFVLPNLTYVRTAEESIQLNKKAGGAIIISASGMADAGRIKHHLKHNLWRKESAIVFIGYQAEGTLGRRLIEGEQKVTIHGEQIDVRANIVNMDGFSAHGDKEEILSWFKKFNQLPKTVFVTHGEEQASLDFSEYLATELKVHTEVPQPGQVFELTTGDIPQLVAQNTDWGKKLLDENILANINTEIQKLALGHDYEKLIRIHEFLQQLT